MTPFSILSNIETLPTVVEGTISDGYTRLSNLSRSNDSSMERTGPSDPSIQRSITLPTLISSLLRYIIPILDTVAGEAYKSESVSKMKQVWLEKLIRSPVGSVSKWLSSSTLFKDSIHSGSMSPSKTIQLWPPFFTNSLELAVKTPSLN